MDECIKWHIDAFLRSLFSEWIWASHFTSLCFGFSTCEVGAITLTCLCQSLRRKTLYRCLHFIKCKQNMARDLAGICVAIRKGSYFTERLALFVTPREVWGHHYKYCSETSYRPFWAWVPALEITDASTFLGKSVSHSCVDLIDQEK